MPVKTLSVLLLGLCLTAVLPSHATVSIQNLSALRGYTYTTGNEFVFVRGYATVYDGGQGFFAWDSAITQSDNDGTVIKVTGVSTGRWMRVYTGPLSVKWFGAKGDSVTDDQPSISHALQAALNVGDDLFLPGAIYKLNSYEDTAGKHIFSPFPAGLSNPYRIRIFGEQQTILRSALYTPTGSNSFFFFNGAYIRCTIENIFFQNTHPLPAGNPSPIGQTDAIYLFGGSAVNNIAFTVRGCNFEGFSTAITLNGTQDTRIERCTFNAPQGRDNAQGTNQQPAVFIWAVSNSNGEVINPAIINCTANGYSGTGPIATSTESKMPMDGFIYGTPEGGLISGNILTNMAQELIYVSPYTDSPSTRPVVISNNMLDCAIPAGSVAIGNLTSPATANYGIRSEAKNSVITGNTLTNITQGIFQYAYNTENYQFRRWQIQDNVLQFTKNTAMSPQSAIYVQGYNNTTERAQFPTIVNNTILADSLTLNGNDLDVININDADSAVVTGNTLILGYVSRAGHVINFSSMTSSYNTYYKDNIIRGQVDAQYSIGASSPSSTYTDWDNFSAQLVTHVTANVTLTAANATVIGNAASASFVVTLPAPSDPTVNARGQGKKFVFRNITSGSSNTMTVSTPSGSIIGTTSGTSLVIGAGTTVSLQTDGTNWYVF